MAMQDDILARIDDGLFAGRMNASQAAGCRFLLEAWRKAQMSDGREAPAYVLATAFHETGAAMTPVKERGGREYLRLRYDVTGRDPARARAQGNTRPGDGARYAGRGYVQLTWKANYERAGTLLGVDLAADPDRALEPELAATILIRGMAEGWFTGRRLQDYFGPGRADFVQARRIVNGLDQAERIAGHARAFLRALEPVTRRPATPPRRPTPRGSRPPHQPARP